MDGSPGIETERSRRSVISPRRTDVHLITIIIMSTKVFCTQASSLQFSKEPKSQDALHGRSAILRCEVSDPADVRYSWMQDGWSVEDSDRRFQEGSNLKFMAVDRHFDTGNFQCVASNSATGEMVTSANASFNIKWLERGPVTMNEPASEAELEDAERITLQCHIDGHPRPSSKWFKDGVQLGGKDRILTLTDLRPEESGIYYCCARNAAGQVCSNQNITLNIIDKTLPRVEVSPEDQVVLRNEEAVFHCQFRAKPPPVLEWFHGTEPVVNKSRVIVYSNGTLRITQVKQRSTGVYKCVAQYGGNKHVQVEAELRIAEIDDMGDRMSRVFSANSRERVTCDPPRGQPLPEVWWERVGHRVPSEGRVYQRDRDLIFNSTDRSDSGVYTCVARNKAGQREQELIVTVATSPEWITEPQNTHMEEGQPGYLHCHAQSTPDPRVTWYRKNIPISDEGSRYKLFSNGTLRINSAEVNDAQIYSCVCVSEGGSLTGHARVYILEKLKFTPVPQPSQCLQLDRESSVNCIAQGRETPTVHWSRTDGSALSSHVSQMNGVLQFRTVIRADAGNYTCVAFNSMQGEIRAHVQLTVGVHIEFKLEPEQTTVYQGHTAVFHCQASGDPSPFIQWMIKDKLLSSSTSRFQKMPNGSLVISDVTTDDTGMYTCIAGNSCNIRDSAAQLYVVEKPVHPRDEDEDKSQFKMFQTIALSVAVAVAYIIAVLGLMFYCKQRRKARRLQKNSGGEEPETECLNGGTVQHNGQTTAEIQEEVALTNLTSTTANEKHQNSTDKLNFPRVHLQTITTLGKGVFGEVFLAKAQSIEEGEEETVVVVKSLQSPDESVQSEFRRELEMFSKVHHPHIVRLLGLCRETQPHYMILEYVDLGDLKQFLRISKSNDEKLKSYPISTKTKVSICAQVADGMQYLSKQRFVHKDLAARNCLISSQRHVKVSSLSLSKDVYNSEYYHHRQVWIPLRWLPAESVFEDDFSSKSDVWAFGVLMWEVFSVGELPYTTLNDEDVLEGLQTGKLSLSPPENCPPLVFSLMNRCWASSPKERPTFSEIAQTLSALPTNTKV
ncbi:inactive tyrosine-protein kinase 7-like isoform X1 [Myxocyprinus asiaticus]|uniref:inactive tyrosine-protein kinase 7-like isoform X1 n=1 Tax=Myxocyprinus asiaticus TaxID=70543 RepID=UPI0022227D46|nr:inactive tyrosine-protein kinase 7-like isoform X1 [Myxocyprinus asiaticus]